MSEPLANLLAKATKWGRDRALYVRALPPSEQSPMTERYGKAESWRDDARSMTSSTNVATAFMEEAAKAFRETMAR